MATRADLASSREISGHNTKHQRYLRLVPGGVPRYLRIYDNQGKTLDRYTIVFTGHYKGRKPGECYYVGASTNPAGYYSHGEANSPIDYPSYGHLGKIIRFTDLPELVQKAVMDDYTLLWSIEEAHKKPHTSEKK